MAITIDEKGMIKPEEFIERISRIVLANGEKLITRNIKHFERVTGLLVESIVVILLSQALRFPKLNNCITEKFIKGYF